jgi:ethanolamine utilization microcompartment shell protein EutL
MDDEEIERLADNNKALISACSDPVAGMDSVVKDYDVVYGIFVSSANMTGWEKVCIKGDERPDATVTAVWCASLDEAEAISRRCGDRST